MSSYIQAAPTNAAVVLNNDVYIFYYDAASLDLYFIVTPIGKLPLQRDIRNAVTINNGNKRGPVRGYPNNYTTYPLAAAADPATGTVWVYYTDENGIISNARTKNRGYTWESGEAISAQIRINGNHNMSVWFDPILSEPRIVVLEFNTNLLSEAYDNNGWTDAYIQP